jgi:S-adenosylmethionine decarboxylase
LDTISHHYLIELQNVDADILNDKDKIEKILLRSIEGSGATYINHYFHKFSPQGVSGVIVIAESHLSIHTWPERAYAALDVFTCGDKSIGETIVGQILAQFNNPISQINYIQRGIIE